MERSGSAYPPSWIDRLVARIDALPLPAWAAYLGVFVVVAMTANLAVWVDGTREFGSLNAYQLSLGFYVTIALAGIHYLDREASRAWRTFRPAMPVDDETAAAIEYRLTTMPVGTTLAWTLIGAVGSAFLFVSFYGTETSIERTPVTFAVNTVLDLVSLALTAVLVYHTVRQLRLIEHLHGQVQHVDLLHLMPLYSFSRVSSATGIVLLAMVYVSLLTNPASLANVGILTGLGITVALSVACFVVPLYGMHTQIAAEKARRLAETNRRLDRALTELARRSDAMDLAQADALDKHLASVITERQLVSSVPTWPWQAETLRWFVTAIVFPLALWLAYRALDSQLT